MNTLATHGLEEPFFQLCCCVSFLFWREIGFGFTYSLCTQSTIQLWCGVSFFLLSREIVFGTYILSVQYSCAVVSVFCCGRKANLVQIFLLNPRIFFLYFLLCMDLQPYSHDCFSKILRTLFEFPNNTYWVFFFQRNNLLIFWTGASCFSVTLFYSTLLALTHGQKDRRRLKYTCFAWAGGTFFPVVLLCHFSFWFWQEIGFGLHTHVLRVQYSCCRGSTPKNAIFLKCLWTNSEYPNSLKQLSI